MPVVAYPEAIADRVAGRLLQYLGFEVVCLRHDPGRAMEIVLHVGLHKTGTTSLQRALLRRYARREPGKPWYPSPESHGPGHAELAWRWLGILQHHGRSDSSALMSVVADARASQCSKLILSAEDFSWAFPHHMERLAEIASLGDLRVIVTLSQMGRRGVSLWQQSVHAGYEKSLAESEALIVGRMVEPDFLAALFSAFGEDRIRVIVVDRDGSRDQMFRHFTNATAVPILPLSESELLHANKSMSVQEAELARLCNECCKRLGVGLLERQSLQVTLRSIFNDERWVEAAAPRPLRMPARWQLSLRTRMQDTIAWVANMHRSGKIHVYGDVNKLDDTSKTQPAAEDDHPIAPQELAKIAAMAAILLHSGWLPKFGELQMGLSQQSEALRECRERIAPPRGSGSWRIAGLSRALAARTKRALSLASRKIAVKKG